MAEANTGGGFLILNEHVTLQVLREGTRTYEWVLAVREEGRIFPPCTQKITEKFYNPHFYMI